MNWEDDASKWYRGCPECDRAKAKAESAYHYQYEHTHTYYLVAEVIGSDGYVADFAILGPWTWQEVKHGYDRLDSDSKYVILSNGVRIDPKSGRVEK